MTSESKAERAFNLIAEKYDGDIEWLKPKIVKHFGVLDKNPLPPEIIVLGALNLPYYRDRGAFVKPLREAINELEDYDYGLSSLIGETINEEVITEETLIIEVYTRNGGGNREHYDCEDGDCTGCSADELEANPYHLHNQDDSFDHTYASFYYMIPKEVREEVEHAYNNPNKVQERIIAETELRDILSGNLTPWAINDMKKYQELKKELNNAERDKDEASRIKLTSNEQALIDYSDGKEYKEDATFTTGGWKTYRLSDVAKAQNKYNTITEKIKTCEKLKKYSDNIPEEMRGMYNQIINSYDQSVMYSYRIEAEHLKKNTLTPFNDALREAKKRKREETQNASKLAKINKRIEELQDQEKHIGWDSSRGEPPQYKH